MFDRYIDYRERFSAKSLGPIWIVSAALFVLICLRWPMALAAVAAAGGVVVLIWCTNYTMHHPKWLVLPLLLNEAVTSVTLIDDSIRPVIRYAMLALFCIPVVATAIRTGLLKRGGYRLYFIYFLWGAVTVTYSIYPIYSIGRLSSAVLLLTALVAVVGTLGNEDSEIYELFEIFWIGSAIIMLVLAASFLLPTDVAWRPDDNGIVRFAGIFNSPNQIGEIVLTTVSSGLILWPVVSSRIRWLIAISISMALTFDLLADSRSPFIALTVGILALAVSKYRLRAVLVAGILLFVAMAVVSRLGSGQGQEYVTRGDVSSLTGRTDVWKYTVHAISERPILGWGYEVEGQIFQNHDFPLWEELWNEGPRSSIHNGYLSRATGVGIPAALLWAFIILRALGFAIFNRGAPAVLKRAALIGAIPILVLNLVESTAGDCRYSVGLLLALIWMLSENARLKNLGSKSAKRNFGSRYLNDDLFTAAGECDLRIGSRVEVG